MSGTDELGSGVVVVAGSADAPSILIGERAAGLVLGRTTAAQAPVPA